MGFVAHFITHQENITRPITPYTSRTIWGIISADFFFQSCKY